MTTAAALSFVDITKDYAGARALAGVTVSIGRGTVHAFVGENGAGKSTLMKVASGAVQATTGRLFIGGTEATAHNPRQAAAAGIAMIYQELTIVPERSALENVLLGNLPTRAGVVRRRAALDAYRRATELIGCTVPADARCSRLSVAHQQLLEIARSLARGSDVIIMDEPTASLGPRDRENLHGAIGRLREAGRTVVIISHDLAEVLQLADQVTVMREGAVQRTAEVSDWTNGSLVDAMLGPAAQTRRYRRRLPAYQGEEIALSVSGVRSGTVDVPRFDLGKGEIVGIAGLVGSGRSEFLRALAGADPVSSGEMRLNGSPVRWPASPRAAKRLGFGFAPEERKTEGLVLGRSAAWNIALPSLGRGVVSARHLLSATEPMAGRVNFPPSRLASGAGTFSGGNQQKLMLARWIHARSPVLLLDEPTRGIDIGAKAEIFELMSDLAAEGVSILWVSSELEEVVTHSHRVVLMARHQLIEPAEPVDSVESILRAVFDLPPTRQEALSS
ncbi:sugar ABC transporter ATP-binding protein [Streptomyces prunicolor]|uniref:sugar ABC transporter ATP-binding protein n=1 Tax=Streptomyces prunicolor TaxID=67348 RepID=UPI003437B9DB